MIFSNDVIMSRQEKSAAALEKAGVNVLVFSGEPVGTPGGLDQTYPFLPHPRHYWLSGFRRSGCVMAYAPGEGWTSFVRPVDEDEILWEGAPEAPKGIPIQQLGDWLAAHSGRKTVVTGSVPANCEFEISDDISEIIDDCRRPKDFEELALMRLAVEAAASGFARARSLVENPETAFAGLTERRIQIELEAEFLRNGANGTGFDTIVAAGTHASVLHFSPGPREVKNGEMVMIDAGAQIHEYSCDVTRTIAAGGKFEPRCRAVYDIVLEAQKAAIAKATPGVEWRDVHIAAATVIADGLKHIGIFHGTTDALVETGSVGMFLPHGTGHMLGLRVRDVGGKIKGRENNTYAGASIRVDMPLREGFVMTVEPGIYFVEPLLNHPERRARYDKFLNREELAKWMNVGGCRIEDDILITAAGHEVLTDGIPK